MLVLEKYCSSPCPRHCANYPFPPRIRTFQLPACTYDTYYNFVDNFAIFCTSWTLSKAAISKAAVVTEFRNGFNTGKKRCIMDHLDIRDLDVRRSADWEALPSNWCPRNLFPPLIRQSFRNVCSLANLQLLWRHRFYLVSAIFHA